MNILSVNNKREERFLRKKTAPFVLSSVSKKEVRELIGAMREEMRKASGIGLAANQIGKDIQCFVAEVPSEEITAPKFYAFFNPRIVKVSSATATTEEGCLSVPGKYGDVERPEKVVVEAEDKNGKKVKIKAWGLLARVLQHEIDHLNGILYIDKAKNIREIPREKRLQEKFQITNSTPQTNSKSQS